MKTSNYFTETKYLNEQDVDRKNLNDPLLMDRILQVAKDPRDLNKVIEEMKAEGQAKQNKQFEIRYGGRFQS